MFMAARTFWMILRLYVDALFLPKNAAQVNPRALAAERFPFVTVVTLLGLLFL